MLYSLKRQLTCFYKWIQDATFDLRLKVLNWQYGVGNIPADKLPSLDLTPDGSDHLVRVILCCQYLDRILQHYRVDTQDSEVAFLMGQLIRREPIETDGQRLLQLVIGAEHPALMLLEMVYVYGDISDAKKNFFPAPYPYGTMEAWLLALEKELNGPKL